MAFLSRLWAGRIYGTNTGNVFAEIEQEDATVSGTLRIMDRDIGLSVYRIDGQFVDSKLTFSGKPVQQEDDVVSGIITASGDLKPNGVISGQWASTLGTAGTFDIYPHDLRGDNKLSPEQIISSIGQLGTIQLYGEEIKRLVGFIVENFDVVRPVVTYTRRGSNVTRYADDFFAEAHNEHPLTYLKIHAQELDKAGINRSVTLELDANGVNTLSVQGTDEAWVTGVKGSIISYLKQFEQKLSTQWRVLGIGLVQIAALSLIAVSPEISGWENRAAFIAVVALLIALLSFIDTKVIKSALIYLNRERPSQIFRLWPVIVSWLSATSSAIAAGAILYFLIGSAT